MEYHPVNFFQLDTTKLCVAYRAEEVDLFYKTVKGGS